jgi:CheY-like chemotaxis protein
MEPRAKKLLVAVGREELRRTVLAQVADAGLEVTAARTAAEASAALAADRFDCTIVDLSLPDSSGLDLAERIAGRPSERKTPVIVYAPNGLSKTDTARMKRLSAALPVKEVQSPERLFDQTALFLHLPVAGLPEGKRSVLEKLYQSDELLTGKKVLIVDDDIRNIFALTSVLEKERMEIFSAETGKGAVETLHNTPGIDVVLMDIMMPDMDGYETMRTIRKSARFRSLPIIAVTAKAMKGDREKTIEAGAWDYLSKPVDAEQMLSVLRAWLCR